MTLPSQPQTPAHEGRRWRWGWVVVLVFVAGIAALGWNIFTWQRAVRQLREAGITMQSGGESMRVRLWKAARGDWRQFFNPNTWRRQQIIWRIDSEKAGKLCKLDAVAPAFKRVNPEWLSLRTCTALENVDGLKGLASLQQLFLSECTSLQNVAGLKGLPSLRQLDLSGCTSLQNVAGLNGLSSLRSLFLSECTLLQDVDGLKRLSRLQDVLLYGCTSLQNVDGLKGLSSLQDVRIEGCVSLQNVDGLKAIKSLSQMNLRGCTKLPPDEVAALKAALPNTYIEGP